MRFGIREAVDVVFKAAADNTKVGGKTYKYHEPVFYFDTLKASTTEGTSTTVYAQGGKGNPRLIAWEGDKAVTFSFTDALIAAESLAMLTGSDLYEASEDHVVTVHQRKRVPDALVAHSETIEWTPTDKNGATLTIDIVDILGSSRAGKLSKEFIYGYITDPVTDEAVIRLGKCDTTTNAGKLTFTFTAEQVAKIATQTQKMLLSVGDDTAGVAGETAKIDENTHINLLIDYYTEEQEGLKEINILPDKFAGYFYIEGDTLFRRERDGVDLPAQLTIPHAKVQTAFTLTMSPEGDPSTFDFTIDAFPGKVVGSNTRKTLYAIQIIEDDTLVNKDIYDYDTSN